MPQPTPLVLHFANLLWLLIHRPNEAREQEAAMRRVLSDARAGSSEISLTDLLVFLDEPKDRSRPQVESLWIKRLATQMSEHSVGGLLFARETTAIDALNLARALTEPPVEGDEGAAFDARVVAFGLQTISVQYGPEALVPGATSAVGLTSRVTPTSALAPGTLVVNPTPTGSTAEAPPTRAPLAEAFLPEFERRRTPRIATDNGMSTFERVRVFETAFSVDNVSRELDDVLVSVDAPMDSISAAQQMKDVTRCTEERASRGLWVEVLEIMKRVLRREEREKEPGVHRAFVVAMRELNQSAILRGIAHLLPRGRELREDATFVLSRYGEEASDVLIELLVATDVATERRAFRVALTHCPAAMPALVHLLGDPRWFVIRNAAELLGEMGVTEADGKLAQTLRHPDTRVRRAAAAALARLGTPRALHALQQALTDKVPAVRLQSALGLGTIRNPRAVTTVIDALEKEEDPEVQAALLRALGSMPTEEAVERLRRAGEPGSLLNRKPTSLRLHAVQALADAGTESARAVLRSFAADRDKEVQAKVGRLLEGRTYAA